MKRVRWPSLVLGAACAVAVFVLLAAGGGARAPGSAVTVPDRLAGYSYLTADVSDAPPGRAVALYQHGFGVEFMDFPQAVVLAADDDVYRRLDAAEARSGPESQGDPAPMLLSPDGRRVALGEHDTTSPDLEIVDLETGGVSRRPLPDTRSVRPVAWSADGTRLTYLAKEKPTHPHRGAPPVGALLVLDLNSGRVQPVPGGAQATAAAFSPDGALLAVQSRGGRAAGAAIVRLSTGAVRALPGSGSLTGPHAWSPDGRLLAVERPSGIWVIDVTGAPASTPARVRLPDPAIHAVLGWSANREVVLQDQAQPDRTRVVAVSLEGGRSRELTRIDGTSDYGVGRLQLATAPMADLTVRAAGDADRGPPPTVMSALVALLCGLVTIVVTSRIGRRLHRRHRPAVSPLPAP